MICTCAAALPCEKTSAISVRPSAPAIWRQRMRIEALIRNPFTPMRHTGAGRPELEPARQSAHALRERGAAEGPQAQLQHHSVVGLRIAAIGVTGDVIQGQDKAVVDISEA